jgi:hypothetical protein
VWGDWDVAGKFSDGEGMDIAAEILRKVKFVYSSQRSLAAKSRTPVIWIPYMFSFPAFAPHFVLDSYIPADYFGGSVDHIACRDASRSVLST